MTINICKESDKNGGCCKYVVFHFETCMFKLPTFNFKFACKLLSVSFNKIGTLKYFFVSHQRNKRNNHS